MSNFSVNTSELLVCSEKLLDCSAEINIMRHNLILCRYELDDSAFSMINETISLLKNKSFDDSKSVTELGSALKQIANKYDGCEQQIVAHILPWELLVSDGDGQPTDNPAFDDIGTYGGHQRSPLDNFEDVAWIVRKYYPDMMGKHVMKFLKKLNSEGCGYVSLINSICKIVAWFTV